MVREEFGTNFIAMFSDELIASKLFLILQKISNENSKWYPYIDGLPTSDELNTPCYFAKNELKYLKGSNIYDAIAQRRELWESQWKEIETLLPNLPQKFTSISNLDSISFDDYLWASTIYTSRSFPAYIIYPETDRDLSMLLPIVDLINHKPLTRITWNGTTENTFDVTVDGTFTERSEIFNNYGAKGNEELLMGYGFCIKDNFADTVALKVVPIPQGVKPIEESGLIIPKDSVYYITEKEPYNKDLIEILEINSTVMRPHTLNKNTETIINKFQAIENYHAALQQKLGKIRHVKKPKDGKEQTLRKYFIGIYLESQKSILKAAIVYCKETFEKYIRSYSENIISLESIFKDKNDSEFEKYCSIWFDKEKIGENTDLSPSIIRLLDFEEETLLVYLVYLMNKGVSWLPRISELESNHLETLLRFTSEEDFKALHNLLTQELFEKIPEVFNVEIYSVENLRIAGALLRTNSILSALGVPIITDGEEYGIEIMTIIIHDKLLTNDYKLI